MRRPLILSLTVVSILLLCAPAYAAPVIRSAQGQGTAAKQVEPDKTRDDGKSKKKKRSKDKRKREKDKTDPFGPAPGSPNPFAPPAGDPTAPGGTSGNTVDTGIRGSDQNWLAKNGLRSPICKAKRGNATTKRNCERSGLASSPTPIDNLTFDIHVDTGGLAPSPSKTFSSVVQNLVNGIWMGMLAITAALFAALEWAFSLNLLDHETLGDLGKQLDRIEHVWTLPVARILVCLTAVWITYQALIAKRVRFAMSEAGMMGGLLALALLVMANPIATVGWLNNQVNSLAVGVISIVQVPSDSATGNLGKARGQASYESGLQAMFDTITVRSWALLEFGDVDFATNPSKLDRKLKQRAIALAHDKPRSVRAAVRSARTNGQLFLAFPTNGPERNSINDIDEGQSLYRVLCGNDDDNECKGPHKDVAEARTESGTWPRVAQVILIGVGLLVMWILLGLIAFGLIGSGVTALFYLLLVAVTSPLAVLGFGNAPRRFRRYLSDLLGAVMAKLIYAVALALVMSIYQVLTSLDSLGYLTQWVLICITLVELLRRRRQLMGIVPMVASPSRLGKAAIGIAAGFGAKRIAGKALGRVSGGGRRGGPARKRVGSFGATSSIQLDPRPASRTSAAVPAASTSSGPSRSRQQHAVLTTEQRGALSRAASAERERPGLEQRRKRLTAARQEVEHKLRAARGQSDEPAAKNLRKREVSLARRLGDVEHRLLSGQRASGYADNARLARRGDRFSASANRRADEWLDQQAALPKPRRSYRRLAALADVTPEQYDRLAVPERQRVRVQINRELAEREAVDASAVSAPQPPSPVAIAVPERQPLSASDAFREQAASLRPSTSPPARRPTPRRRRREGH